MSKAFTFREVAGSNRYCVIVPDDYSLFPKTTTGSYALAPARVLGLSYPDYLKFIKTLFPEQIVLKKGGYIVAYWQKGKELYTFIDLLNKKVKLMRMIEVEEQEDELDE